ncbi:hypothetical protein BDF14DRAFT_1760530 [Spinellus fusiger]|nr:hypothetical protein BDF14DRAFT_1760530 [Spinellus fusiger]
MKAACSFKGSMRRESKASNFSDENASGDCPYSDGASKDGNKEIATAAADKNKKQKNTSIDLKDQVINPIPCPPRLPFVGNLYDMLPDM